MEDEKSIISLTQFEATFWAKHNTYWQWNKIWKIMTLIWRMQMWRFWRKQLAMSLNQANVTNVTIHLLIRAIWGHIWKCTVEKSQTSATNVTMHPLRQAIWGLIWKCTVEKSPTSATSVALHSVKQAIWGGIWKRIVAKSFTNATNVAMHPLRQDIWGLIW